MGLVSGAAGVLGVPGRLAGRVLLLGPGRAHPRRGGRADRLAVRVLGSRDRRRAVAVPRGGVRRSWPIRACSWRCSAAGTTPRPNAPRTSRATPLAASSSKSITGPGGGVASGAAAVVDALMSAVGVGAVVAHPASVVRPTPSSCGEPWPCAPAGVPTASTAHSSAGSSRLRLISRDVRARCCPAGVSAVAGSVGCPTSRRLALWKVLTVL